MKKTIFLFFLTLPIFLLLGMDMSYAVNLLENPGFEMGDFPPENWSDWSGSESDRVENDGIAGFPGDRSHAHLGNRSGGKILYGSGERWGGFSQTIDIAGGGAFKASGWVMNNKNDGAMGKGAKAYIEIKFLDESKFEIKVVKSSTVRRPARWTKLYLNGVIPSKSRQVIFSFVLIGAKSSRGKVLFDDASFDVRD